jgi:hypothetical protein
MSPEEFKTNIGAWEFAGGTGYIYIRDADPSVRTIVVSLHSPLFEPPNNPRT